MKPLLSAKKWLRSRYERKQWVSRWTWNHLTLGVHSTQQSESIHASIKYFLSSHTLLTDLQRSWKNIARKSLREGKEGNQTSYYPIENRLSKRIVSFRYVHRKSQITLCIQYTVDETSYDDKSNCSGEIFFCKQALVNEHIGSPTELVQKHLFRVITLLLVTSLPWEITTSSETVKRVSLSSCAYLFPLIGPTMSTHTTCLSP